MAQTVAFEQEDPDLHSTSEDTLTVLDKWLFPCTVGLCLAEL